MNCIRNTQRHDIYLATWSYNQTWLVSEGLLCHLYDMLGARGMVMVICVLYKRNCAHCNLKAAVRGASTSGEGATPLISAQNHSQQWKDYITATTRSTVQEVARRHRYEAKFVPQCTVADIRMHCVRGCLTICHNQSTGLLYLGIHLLILMTKPRP